MTERLTQIELAEIRKRASTGYKNTKMMRLFRRAESDVQKLLLLEVDAQQAAIDSQREAMSEACRKLSSVAIERSHKGVPEIVEICDRQAIEILQKGIGATEGIDWRARALKAEAIVDAQRDLIREYETVTERDSYSAADYDEDSELAGVILAEKGVEAAQKGGEA